MEIVITMAGLGSRFREAGYNIPKYMFEVKDRTLFEWSMASLSYFYKENKFYFIVKKDEKTDVIGFINKKCTILGIKKYAINEIDYLTRGQAETAILASKQWNKNEKLLIYNIDTYVKEGCMKNETFKGDGFLPCFIGEGTHWSFAKVDSNKRVLEVKEKERISDFCTIGAYYFRSCKLYENIYKQYYGQEKQLNSEQYVAPMYNWMIQHGYEIYSSQIDAQNVHVLGTPEEVEQFKKERKIIYEV